VLSVLAHPEEAVARAALTSIGSLAEDRARLYFDVILAALPETVRAALEAWMQKHEYHSEFARRYLQQGIEEGIERGIEQGIERGIEQGIERGLQRAVLALASAKVRGLSPDEEAHVHRIDDASVLEQLLLDLGAAADEPAARAVVARLGAS
jgi:flagellar biosynthesis/type III secretory pathway protein FliH